MINNREFENRRHRKGTLYTMKNFLAIRPIKTREFTSPNGKKNTFSELEARISLQMDFDYQNLVSYSGFASLWNWNSRTVKKFIEENCLMIIERVSKNKKALGRLKPSKEAIKLKDDSPIIIDKTGRE